MLRSFRERREIVGTVIKRKRAVTIRYRATPHNRLPGPGGPGAGKPPGVVTRSGGGAFGRAGYATQVGVPARECGEDVVWTSTSLPARSVTSGGSAIASNTSVPTSTRTTGAADLSPVGPELLDDRLVEGRGHTVSGLQRSAWAREGAEVTVEWR